MKTTQAWGWLAAGVLALGLNGFYHDDGAAWAHQIVDEVRARVADRSGTLADLASAQADRFMERANLVAARDETASCRLATTMARFQTKIARSQAGFAHFEAMSARQEAGLARVEAQRARIVAPTVRVQVATEGFRPGMVRAVNVPLVCSRLRMNVPRVPMVRIPAPVAQVEMPSGGPI
jgi:hypothetical protein